MFITSLFSSVKEYWVGQKVHSHKLLWQNLNKLFGQPNILLLIKTWLQFILRALFSFTLSCRAWWVNPLVHHCSETQRQEAKIKPTISDHKEGDGGRSQEGEERKFYHQKKKEVKLWRKKIIGMHQVLRGLPQISLKGKFCIVWATRSIIQMKNQYNVGDFPAKSLLQGWRALLSSSGDFSACHRELGCSPGAPLTSCNIQVWSWRLWVPLCWLSRGRARVPSKQS